jgi:hypothetical protein
MKMSVGQQKTRANKTMNEQYAGRGTHEVVSRELPASAAADAARSRPARAAAVTAPVLLGVQRVNRAEGVH